jgi:hypothetical protein
MVSLPGTPSFLHYCGASIGLNQTDNESKKSDLHFGNIKLEVVMNSWEVFERQFYL